MSRFIRNLSFISQPCVRVAAMVVSEIMDKLSPNMAPPMTTPSRSVSGMSVCSPTPTAMGAMAATVPMLVPIAVEMKAPMRKSPGRIMDGGRRERPKLTVAFTPPMAEATDAKPPARRKIMHMVMMLISPAPDRKTAILRFSPSFPCARARTMAGMIATVADN